jgi:hypothetical protein
MNKSGLADSPLFSLPGDDPASVTQTPVKEKPVEGMKPITHSGNQDTMLPVNHDTTVSRYHDEMVEKVRKAVKTLGKEASTHRCTVAEKKAVADIVYCYKNIGIKTSENEITRIGLNYLLHDYTENGENSLLDKVLKALNA